MDTLSFQSLFHQIILTLLSLGICFILFVPIYWMIVERKNVKQKQWRR